MLLCYQKSQYQKIRNASRENCSTLFSSYNKVHRAKLKCYPRKTDISVTECSAEIKLQALLDHTIKRILLTQTDVINSMPYEEVRNLNSISKWGVAMAFLAKVHSNKNLPFMMEASRPYWIHHFVFYIEFLLQIRNQRP